MRILDLFCGGGGAAEGYLRAFSDAEIVGVDIADHSANYPGIFVQGDAMEYLADNGRDFDFIHASPPCQGYSPHVSSRSSQWVPTKGKDEPRLIDWGRRVLIAQGKPYAIENVMGARNEMRSPVLLCGSMFGRKIVRHRLFETSFPVDLLPHPNCKGIAKAAAAELGWEYRDMSVTGKGRRKGTGERWAQLLGVTPPHDAVGACRGYPARLYAVDWRAVPSMEKSSMSRYHRTDLRYDDGKAVHACEGNRMVPFDQGTFLVWTRCGRDVPANRAFTQKYLPAPTCPECTTNEAGAATEK